MAITLLRPAPAGLRHVRKTVTFDGTAGGGAVGSVSVFSITGRVLVERWAGFCTSSLTEAAPSADIQLGTASATALIHSNISALNIDAGEFLQGTPAASINYEFFGQRYFIGASLSEDIIVTVNTQNVTGGVVIYDIWYLPITDNGLLVAA